MMLKKNLPFFLLVIFLVSNASGQESKSLKGENKYRLENIRVIDGDTLEADILLDFEITLRNQRIRASDFDAWEISNRRRTVEVTDSEIEKGKIATQSLKKLLDAGQVYIVPAKRSRDTYGRILGAWYVARPDRDSWRSVAEFMTQQGHTRNGQKQSP